MNEIASLLQAYLEAAKGGAIHHVAVSAVGPDGQSRSDFAGMMTKDGKALASVQILGQQLQDRIANWKLPEPDPSLGADYACYHCGTGPAGFDFIPWLVHHEMLRVKAGAPAPLKVAFWLGHKPAKSGWVDNVYRPALKFVGAVEDDKAFGREGSAWFTTKPIVEMFHEGAKVPVFKPAGQWQLPREVITITLREAPYWPHRNSNIEAWLKFARKLQRQGERVVFVRDTAKADEPLEEFETCPLASRNLDARMWLYDNAKLNCFVANGPWSLAQFSDKPLLCFTVPEREDSTYIPNKPSYWKDAIGIMQGEQYPWHNEHQRIVWARDGFDNIMEAFRGCVR